MRKARTRALVNVAKRFAEQRVIYQTRLIIFYNIIFYNNDFIIFLI